MLTITDLFCGAGGSSSGAVQVPGVRVRMAANHWRLAVDTHNINHPDADHDCADISQTDPRRYPTTDILWASPECTNHSQAKGTRKADKVPDLFDQVLPDEAAERSRATMFDVLRFAEVHHYRAIIVENVVDVRDWRMWPAWMLGLDNLGYDHQVVYLNSMFAHQAGAPAPQSRDRLYVVAWRVGDRRPNLTRWTSPRAWCPKCEKTVTAVQSWKRLERQRGRYRQQYVYRCPIPRCHIEVMPGVLPAAAAIDWTLTGERIGDRSRPLAPKTLARIEAGLQRYARPPFLALLRSDRARTVPVDQPLATIVADGSGHGLVGEGLLVPAGGTWNDEARPTGEPFRTRTTRDTEALVVPVEGRDNLTARSATGPMRTQTARLQDALVVPLRANNTTKAAHESPLDTVAAAGNHHALVKPPMPGEDPLIRWDHLVYGYDSGSLRTVDGPLPTQTTIEGDAVLGPSVAVDDCTFRMLEPHEIQAAMAFGREYQVLGNKRERVRQLGNAVTPPAARDLIAAVAEALTGEQIQPGTNPPQ
ncbi:DNA cytosine methyltransferase [Micromonospora parva]|uniref:DNA cytosine methyltransferase n=1 Tax=Micromonospora parva TaxID=1464048 RepID=UPI00366D8533